VSARCVLFHPHGREIKIDNFEEQPRTQATQKQHYNAAVYNKINIMTLFLSSSRAAESEYHLLDFETR
jgi:hypothetical protein